jgi:CO/xanthine dehydrogenase Mo-binding subunit
MAKFFLAHRQVARPVAAAVAKAVFDATGVRLRRAP